MSESASSNIFDADSVRAKYKTERDKRQIDDRGRIRDLRSDAFFADFRRDPFTEIRSRAPIHEQTDVVIVGAGMAGVLLGARLRDAGVQRIRLIDEAGGVGGTWYWNRYPG